MSAMNLDPNALPAGLLDERGSARLHIGGVARKAGWQVFDIQPGPHVDHVGDLRDLSRFADGSFDMVYASHVLEHLGMKDVPGVLGGVARILRPGGRFFVGVPDLTTLCWLFTHPDMGEEQRDLLMHMMFGGQSDEHDFHHTGFWDYALVSQLAAAGFGDVYKVQTFGLFDDSSNSRVGEVLVSLNLVAVK